MKIDGLDRLLSQLQQANSIGLTAQYQEWLQEMGLQF